MPDIRSSSGGKLIYQLTSASALNGNELFAISTSDYLTRSVTLSQIGSFIKSDIYSTTDIDNIFNDLRDQIMEINNQLFELESNITEFRNEFNNKLNALYQNLIEIINDLDSKLSLRITNAYNELNTKIENVNITLSNRITALDERITLLENKLAYKYGNTAPPSDLEEGMLYLQWF